MWINLPDTDFAGLFGYTVTSSFENIHVDTAYIIGFDSVGTLVASLSSGVYILTVRSAEGMISKRIIKK